MQIFESIKFGHLVTQRESISFLLAIALPVGLTVVGLGGAFLFLPLAAFALFSPRHALVVLLSIVLLRAANHALLNDAIGNSGLSWVTVFFCCGRIVFSAARRFVFSLRIVTLSVFVSTAAILSAIFSELPAISLLKLISFAIVAFSLLCFSDQCASGNGSSAPSLFASRRILFAFLLGVVLLSLGTLVNEGISFYTNEKGFQGILRHPQTLAAILAPLCAWLLGALMVRAFVGWQFLTLVAIASAMLLASEARTAGLAVIGALFICSSVALLWRDDWLADFSRTFSNPLVLCVLLLLSMLTVLYFESFWNGVVDFLFKGTSETSFSEAFYSSRGFLLERMLTNIYNNSLVGIGFGVPSDTFGLQIDVDEFLGLPIGAPIEKGNAFLQVLEETGIVGTLAFASMLFVIVREVMRYAPLDLALLFVASLFVNVGEAILFSPGGVGLCVWVNIAIALSVCGNPNEKKSKDLFLARNLQYSPSAAFRSIGLR